MSFKGYLKQSTAVDVLVGPFPDDSDGNTDETGLTITPADVRLSKNSGNMAAKNEGTSLVHDELAMYVCKFDVTDTNTVGILDLIIHESGALTVVHTWQVLEENVYDAWYAASAAAGTDLAAIKTDATLIVADTDELQSDDVPGLIAALNDPTAIAIATELLTIDWTTISGEASRSVLNALRVLRNKISIAGGTLTIKEEDDTTTAWTAAVTTSAGNPISEIDPV